MLNEPVITKTPIYAYIIMIPLNSTFYTVKLGFTGVYIILLKKLIVGTR